MSTSICGKWTQETPFSNMEAILDTVGESHTVSNDQILTDEIIKLVKPVANIKRNVIWQNLLLNYLVKITY